MCPAPSSFRAIFPRGRFRFVVRVKTKGRLSRTATIALWLFIDVRGGGS